MRPVGIQEHGWYLRLKGQPCSGREHWRKMRVRDRTMPEQGPVGHDMDSTFESKSIETTGGFSAE